MTTWRCARARPPRRLRPPGAGARGDVRAGAVLITRPVASRRSSNSDSRRFDGAIIVEGPALPRIRTLSARERPIPVSS